MWVFSELRKTLFLFIKSWYKGKVWQAWLFSFSSMVEIPSINTFHLICLSSVIYSALFISNCIAYVVLQWIMEKGLLVFRLVVRNGEGVSRLFSLPSKGCGRVMGRGSLLLQHRLFCGPSARLFQKQQEIPKSQPIVKKDAPKPVPGIPYNKLSIGVPKEIWKNERRYDLTSCKHIEYRNVYSIKQRTTGKIRHKIIRKRSVLLQL